VRVRAHEPKLEGEREIARKRDTEKERERERLWREREKKKGRLENEKGFWMSREKKNGKKEKKSERRRVSVYNIYTSGQAQMCVAVF